MIGSDDGVILKTILSLGANTNGENSDDLTPPCVAAREGNVNAVKLLLNAGRVDVNRADKRGLTPFSYAAKNGYDNVLRLLKDAGVIEVDERYR